MYFSIQNVCMIYFNKIVCLLARKLLYLYTHINNTITYYILCMDVPTYYMQHVINLHHMYSQIKLHTIVLSYYMNYFKLHSVHIYNKIFSKMQLTDH